MDSDEKGGYKPVVIATERSRSGAVQGIMMVELSECGACNKPMIGKQPQMGGHGPFPVYYQETFEAQVKRAGWVVVSGHMTVDIPKGGLPICVDCAGAGKIKFICVLCGEARNSDLSKVSFGWGQDADHLCTVCFETVTAEVWAEAETRLSESHRYDNC